MVKRPDTAERNQDIMRLYNETQNASAVAAHFGLSREAVRRIMKKMGVEKSPRIANVERIRQEVAKLVQQGRSTNQIAFQLRLERTVVNYHIRAAGLKDMADENNRVTSERELERELDDLKVEIDRVRSGMSVKDAAEYDADRVERLSRVVSHLGLGRSRFRDLSHRGRIIKEMRAKKISWEEILDKINDIETASGLRPVKITAIKHWAKMHLGEEYS